MRRYSDLIKKILVYMEGCKGNPPFEAPRIEKYTMEQVHYHIGLCNEAEYLHVIEHSARNTLSQYEIKALTWKGHEVLDGWPPEVD